MPFKKLNSQIKEKLESLNITTPTPFQKTSIPVVKSGANTYCIAPKGSGKTTALVLNTLHKLKFQDNIGNSPRAFVLVENNQKALEIYNTFLIYTRYKSIRVYIADESLHVDTQKSEIFEGVDILISTPRRMNKLFLLNGINSSQLMLFSVDDAEFLNNKDDSYTDLMSITQSINKCQFVLYADKMTSTIKRFESYFMQYAKIINL